MVYSFYYSSLCGFTVSRLLSRRLSFMATTTTEMRTRSAANRAVPRRAGCTWMLSDDVHLSILVHLSASDLAAAARVSRTWATTIAMNSLWVEVCHRTWVGRHVSDACRRQHVLDARAALRRSLAEARSCHIDKAMLCGLTWSFRFKRVAGREWTDTDPYWLGLPARTVCFESDGGLRFSEQCWEGMMRWKLEGGCILRVKHAVLGSFPGEKLVRHPTNWGFVFHSAWVVYSSFSMSRASDDKCMSDRSLARSVDTWQWHEAAAYNEDGIESDSDSEGGGPPAFPEVHTSQTSTSSF